MRLKQYLKEAIIQSNKKEVKLFKDLITKERKKVLKRDPEGQYEHMIFHAMKSVASQITKKIKDLEVEFILVNVGTLINGQAGADYPKHKLEVMYNITLALEYWHEDDNMFEVWLSDILNVVDHELVHIEQYRKLVKVKKKDYGEVFDILGSIAYRQTQAEKKSSSMDAYLQDTLEIMVLDSLKSKEKLPEIQSEAFSKYYIYMYKKYPKTWRKFIKYFVMFLEKRAKKEKK